ncbi:hypothetical protein P175DRAFT_0531331 [Aspergillus ochraceoroseus IBT 24754]|uniref:Uncharacterized protein n=1 Tax=Aspergillus ochraceoroseus IBT 24754 TaxID=1392256 RepID=A0A2T5LZU1_9EURO|nr:uncharacterized protein P175DRAFT_0531331 [Aspergillus ochraceoroseus IBT 24754]PTU21801.1 hypothetical protein P175DRAFT_0531331 [Aspergillus ochraceoroseus IBT 24754]
MDVFLLRPKTTPTRIGFHPGPVSGDLQIKDSVHIGEVTSGFFELVIILAHTANGRRCSERRVLHVERLSAVILFFGLRECGLGVTPVVITIGCGFSSLQFFPSRPAKIHAQKLPQGRAYLAMVSGRVSRIQTCSALLSRHIHLKHGGVTPPRDMGGYTPNNLTASGIDSWHMGY